MTNTQFGSILVVCTANVCRSPLAQFVLQDALHTVPGFGAVRVASGGVKAATGAGVCELVRASQTGRSWAEFLGAHRAAPVTKEQLGRARLILTASREMRGALAVLEPSARTRTFTLREAELLGAGFGGGGSYGATRAGASAVSAFAHYANARRGSVSPPNPRRSFLPWMRRETDPLTIEDGHNGSAREHRATIEEVQSTALAIAALITGTAAAGE